MHQVSFVTFLLVRLMDASASGKGAKLSVAACSFSPACCFGFGFWRLLLRRLLQPLMRFVCKARFSSGQVGLHLRERLFFKPHP